MARELQLHLNIALREPHEVPPYREVHSRGEMSRRQLKKLEELRLAAQAAGTDKVLDDDDIEDDDEEESESPRPAAKNSFSAFAFLDDEEEVASSSADEAPPSAAGPGPGRNQVAGPPEGGAEQGGGAKKKKKRRKKKQNGDEQVGAAGATDDEDAMLDMLVARNQQGAPVTNASGTKDQKQGDALLEELLAVDRSGPASMRARANACKRAWTPKKHRATAATK